VAPQAFLAALPAIASPLPFGAMVAFLVNLLTLPLVGRRAELVLPPDRTGGRVVSEWLAGLAGAWGLKAETARAADHALVEMVDLLTERRDAGITLRAAQGEDRVEVTLGWDGPPLPRAASRPNVQDLLGEDPERHAYSMWLATRQVARFTQRSIGARTEARLVFED